MKIIDADKLMDSLNPKESVWVGLVLSELIANAPTVDAEPVRHGHWIRNDNGTYSCSECQSWIPNEQHYYARYCLHCGAKMDRKVGEDDGI